MNNLNNTPQTVEEKNLALLILNDTLDELDNQIEEPSSKIQKLAARVLRRKLMKAHKQLVKELLETVN